jgi:hypothetical protein
MSKILISDLNINKELDRTASRAIYGGYYLRYSAIPSPPAGPVPVPYPNTGLMSNTLELTSGGNLIT